MRRDLLFSFLVLTAASAQAGNPENSYWQVTSKACGERALSMPTPEKYLILPGLLVRIGVASDSAERGCISAHVYSREMLSFGPNGGSYVENSSLVANSVRTVCRRKVDGIPVDPPLSDETRELDGALSSVALTSVGDSLSLRITGADECSNDVLAIESVRSN